jgi:hypothetical protein
MVGTFLLLAVTFAADVGKGLPFEAQSIGTLQRVASGKLLAELVLDGDMSVEESDCLFVCRGTGDEAVWVGFFEVTSVRPGQILGVSEQPLQVGDACLVPPTEDERKGLTKAVGLVKRLIDPYIPYNDTSAVSEVDDDRGKGYVSVWGDLVSLGAEAVPPLLLRLPASGNLVQLRILGTLSRMGEEIAPVLPELRRLLHDGNPVIRAAAAKCFRALGPAGREALPDLFPLLDDSDEIAAAWAARAIDAVEPDFVKMRLQELLVRLGTPVENVQRMRLRPWYRHAAGRARDPAVARDLRHWTLIVHFTGRDGLRVDRALGLSHSDSD